MNTDLCQVSEVIIHCFNNHGGMAPISNIGIFMGRRQSFYTNSLT
jgi:hypothetical protein